MRSTSPSPSPSPSLRDRTPTKEQAIALEGLARLSTDVFTEKPFGGLVICVTGLSKGEDISNHTLRVVIIPVRQKSQQPWSSDHDDAFVFAATLTLSTLFFSPLVELCQQKKLSCAEELTEGMLRY